MADLSGLKVPKALQPVAEEIADITDAVCLAVLDEEYAGLARRAIARLARKRPSPLTAGRRATWAAGVVYALGQANFLLDPANEPCVTADQLSDAFGVAKSTMGSKARQVRDLLRISPLSPEFQRAEVIAQNPLNWIIAVNGLAVDVRHAPPYIQAEAFDRGLIPCMPALGADGAAARERAQMGGMAQAAVAPPEEAGLLEHCAELKRQLVEFGCSRRFAWELNEMVRKRTSGAVPDEAEFTNLLDRFVLQQPLADGHTVVEIFACEHPGLTDADRRILLRWREVVEGVFEIRERASGAVIAVSLADKGTYQIRANAGPAALAPMRAGCFMTARVVPVGGDWMLSGAQQLYPASQRAEMLRLAAKNIDSHA
jgi:hypothetical protein